MEYLGYKMDYEDYYKLTHHGLSPIQFYLFILTIIVFSLFIGFILELIFR